jgi:hypothetical protein
MTHWIKNNKLLWIVLNSIIIGIISFVIAFDIVHINHPSIYVLALILVTAIVSILCVLDEFLNEFLENMD